MAEGIVISAVNLGKTYPNGNKAVDSVSLEVKNGEIFGILGPNGSGKTTTILMMLGLTEPTGGSINILGLDPLRSPLEVKRKAAYMPDTVGFYEDLSAFDNLDYTLGFLGLDTGERKKRIHESLEKMRLDKHVYEKVNTFSHGMKRRLGLAEVIARRPGVAILDEPTQGLDPESASEFLELIQHLRESENMTIILSSHLLDQVQSVCDRVGLFNRGKMPVCGTVPELATKIIGGRLAVSLVAEGDGIGEKLRSISGVSRVETRGEGNFLLESEKDVRSEAAQVVVASGGKLHEISMKLHTLDSIYRKYYREASNDES